MRPPFVPLLPLLSLSQTPTPPIKQIRKPIRHRRQRLRVIGLSIRTIISIPHTLALGIMPAGTATAAFLAVLGGFIGVGFGSGIGGGGGVILGFTSV